MFTCVSRVDPCLKQAYIHVVASRYTGRRCAGVGNVIRRSRDIHVRVTSRPVLKAGVNPRCGIALHGPTLCWREQRETAEP